MRLEHWLYTIPLRFRSLFRRKQSDRDLDDELRDHIERKTEEYVTKGLSLSEARRQALLELRGIDQTKEACRDARGVRWLQDFAQDLRFGLRMFRKSPGFTIVAVLTLALGIGANTAIFSVIDSLLLRPLPVRNPSQLAVLAFQQGSGPLLTQFSIADYQDIRAATKTAFSGMLGFQIGLDGLSLHNKASRVLTSYVTGNYFSVLGLNPAFGRLFLPSEGHTPGADPVVVLSYSFWQSQFGGDRAIVGQRVLINGRPSTVVGIAPPGFHGLYPAPAVDAFVPVSMCRYYEPGWPKDFMVKRILQNLFILGRLRSGVSLDSAAASLRVVANRLSAQYPDTDKSMALSVYAERFARPSPAQSGALIKAAALFLALVVLVLLLACANTANLLLVRATVREREMTVRAALGAARSRMVRQMLTESILLAAVGGAAGLVLGFWGARMIGSIQLHTAVPVYLYSGFDWRVFAYALAAVLLTGILVGLFPALRASRGRLGAVLHESGRSIAGGKNRLRTSLVVLQVAGSLMLLIVAALFARSLANVQRTNLGFDPHHVVDLTMDPTEVGLNGEQGLVFYNSLLARVRALPGVIGAALTGSIPMSNYSNNDYLKISDYQNPPGQGLPLVGYSVVSPGYFDTLRIPIVRGRGLPESDAAGFPYVAVVNRSFAERFWPAQNPIGKHFAKVSGATNPLFEVVGVTQNSRISGLTGPIEPYFYLPLAQDYALAPLEVLQIRSAAPPDAMIRAAEAIVHDLSPNLPVFNVQTMDEGLDTLSGFLVFRIGAGLAASLGLLGLVLALVGVYGVISYSVSQRAHEIGIRMALGAHPFDILGMILRQGMLIVGGGIAIGCLAAFALARVVSGFLVGVGPADPLTYFGVASLLCFIAIAASCIPARRAARLDPVVALRHE